MPYIVSIQVGTPTEYGRDGAADPMDQRWFTSFYKQPVSGPIRVLTSGLEGNEQADCRFHGGPTRRSSPTRPIIIRCGRMSSRSPRCRAAASERI